MNIRKATKEDLGRCLVIAQALPEWFDDKALSEIEKDLDSLPTYVCDNGGVVAFVCTKETSDRCLEIVHLAVSKTEHNKGVGTKLIKYIETELAPNKLIEVKTLDESAEYEPYVNTRKFYAKNGFVKTDVIDPYPEWGPGNPCAVYIKAPK